MRKAPTGLGDIVTQAQYEKSNGKGGMIKKGGDSNRRVFRRQSFKCRQDNLPNKSTCPPHSPQTSFPAKFTNANLQRAGNPVTSFKHCLHPPAVLLLSPKPRFLPSLRMQTCSGRGIPLYLSNTVYLRPPRSSCPQNLVFPKFANANLQRAGNPVISFKLRLHPPAVLLLSPKPRFF